MAEDWAIKVIKVIKVIKAIKGTKGIKVIKVKGSKVTKVIKGIKEAKVSKVIKAKVSKVTKGIKGIKDTKGIKVSPQDDHVEITVIRKNGSDGIVTVDYETIQLGNQDHVALDGVHYKGQKGKLEFGNQETEKTVQI